MAAEYSAVRAPRKADAHAATVLSYTRAGFIAATPAVCLLLSFPNAQEPP
jgi:hypothetical protein